MIDAVPPKLMSKKPTPKRPAPKKKEQWGFLITRKVTRPSAESENLELFSNVRDANRIIRRLAPLEGTAGSHVDWREEIGAHGELKLTNKLDGDKTIVYEAQRQLIRPEGYGKPLRPKTATTNNNKRNRKSSQEYKREMANWEGWVFNDDFRISESELSYWQGWQLDICQDTLRVKGKKMKREEDGDLCDQEMAHWDGWTQEYHPIGGRTPVDKDAIAKALEGLDHHEEAKRKIGV